MNDRQRYYCAQCRKWLLRCAHVAAAWSTLNGPPVGVSMENYHPVVIGSEPIGVQMPDGSKPWDDPRINIKMTSVASSSTATQAFITPGAR